MRWIAVAVCAAVMAGCGRQESAPEKFRTEVMNRYTPVKDQGRSQTCWAYAMLAAIETEHLTRGDSVHLSVAYAVRGLVEDRCRLYYLSGGRHTLTTRATAQTLINTISLHGAVPHDAYSQEAEAGTAVLCNKLRLLGDAAIKSRAGLKPYSDRAAGVIDGTLGPVPRKVFMLGAEYTPQEFARSVCAPGEYAALTSFTHHPFGTRFALEVPDNLERDMFLNVPIDTLMARLERAVRTGRGVCWEGDTSEPGFSFARGTAVLSTTATVTQESRQRAFERFETTDDHCMAVVGIARDSRGRKYFVMKNSWGTDNPYGGLMYVAEDYVRMKTVAVFLPADV